MERLWFAAGANRRCVLLVQVVALVGALSVAGSGYGGQHSAQSKRLCPTDDHGWHGRSSASSRYSRSHKAVSRRQPDTTRQREDSGSVSADRRRLSLVSLSQVVVKLSRQQASGSMLTGYLQELMSPGRLQRASGKELSQAAHGIAGGMKSCHASQISPVIVTIANQVTAVSGRRLRSWNIQDLSMLASAFNVQRQLPGTVDALKVIAEEVASRGAGYRRGERWQGHSLISLANIFSTLEGTRARHALQTIADEVVGQRARYKNRQGDAIVPLVIMASALSKAEGERIQAALREIAREIVRPNGELIDWQRWQARDLAMMANALGKAEGRRINRALRAIARAMVSSDPSVALLRWSPKHLSNAAAGISKNAQDADVIQALRAIAGVIAGHQRLADSKVWSAQDLAMVAGGLSKTTGTSVQQALGAIAAVVVKRGDLANSGVWTHLHLSVMANALSKAGDAPAVTQALILIAEAVVHRERELQEQGEWQTQDLALVANAISHVNHDQVTKALIIVAREVVRRRAGLHRHSEWTPGFLSMVAGAFGKVAAEPVYPALRLIARELAQRKAQLYKRDIWPVLELVNIANAIGKVPVDDAIAEGLITLADVVADRAERLNDPEQWRLRYLALMSNALTKMEGDSITRAVNSIAVAVHERHKELNRRESRSIQNLVNLASSFNKVSGEPAITALRVIARVVAQEDTDLADRSEWFPQNLAGMAMALSKVPDNSVIKVQNRMAAVVMPWLSEPEGKQAWSVSDLGMLASGMGLNSCSGAFEQIVDSMLALPADRDELAWLLIRMGRWHLLDSHLLVAARLFQGLADLDFHFNELSRLDQLMWVATVMDYRSQTSGTDLFAAERPFAAAYKRYHQQYQHRSKVMAAMGSSVMDDQSRYENRWHRHFVRDYWKGGRSKPEIERASPSELQRVSRTQRYLYDKLCTLFSDTTMETRINGFPVDIMVGSHICIEVDGPLHFAPCGEDSDDVLGCRITKDGLIDYMLGQYHCQVVRIPYTATDNEQELESYIKRIAALRKAGKTLTQDLTQEK